MTHKSLKLFSTSLLFLMLLLIGKNLQAQKTGKNNFESFRDAFKNEYFSVGGLLQTVGDYQPERTAGNNGFSVGNARLQVYGEFDQRFGYQLQANFIKNPAILDANMYFKFTPDFSVKAGLFKSPFSYEFLTGAAAVDFVNRSTVVNQLAPNRQIGFQINGNTATGILYYSAGVFNGNGLGTNQNSDNQFLYVGRLETRFSSNTKPENTVIFGVNASYEQKEIAAETGNIRSQFEGDQTLLGSDLRITHGDAMLSGEFIYSWLEEDIGAASNPFGYHVTAGYFVTPKTQLLVRWDRFDGDHLTRDSESIIGGLNIFPSSFSELQLNYIIPTDTDIEFSQVLLNLQINF